MSGWFRVAALAGLLCAGAARAEDCAVSAEEWSRPRSAAMVVALPGVRACVARWHGTPGDRLVIVHAPGEEGALWAAELRDWLVALGVPSARILLRATGDDVDRVLIRIEPALSPP